LILTGEVEVALVHSRPTYKQLRIEPFSVDPATAFVASNHPLARKKNPTLEEMNAAGFIITDSPSKLGVTARFLEYLRRKRLRPRIVLRCDSEETKNAAVKKFLGIGLGFRGAIERDIENGDLVELPLPGLRLSGNSYMIYHRKRPLSQAGLEFIGMLRRYRSGTQEL
jgi:LysR family transcriptional regulator, transcriptional activator of the cysJI operon